MERINGAMVLYNDRLQFCEGSDYFLSLRNASKDSSSKRNLKINIT